MKEILFKNKILEKGEFNNMVPTELKKFDFGDINTENSRFLANVQNVFKNPTDTIY